MSIDIDGNDYHIFQGLKVYRPKLILIEFNPTIPNEINFVQQKNVKINQEISIQNNIKEYFKSTNGLLLGRAIFANVSENNIYNALILGVSINPKLNEKFEFAKWQEKYNTQFGVEFGLAGQNVLLFSNILVTKAENSLAGSFGVGIAILFDKIQFRLQVAVVKSKSKQILEEKAKNNKIATIFTIAFKN